MALVGPCFPLSFHDGIGFISQASSPVHSEKQVPLGAAWEVTDFQPERVETQPRVVSLEEVGGLRSGREEQLTRKTEHRPFPKNGEKDSEHAQSRDRGRFILER